MAPDTASALTLADEHRDMARSRILRAAMAVLAERGLAATVDDVAEAAGVSRRTVFRHFATRDGLFAAAIREGMQRYALRIPAPPPDGDLRSWLADLLLVVHRLNASNGRVYWELALEPEGLSGELAGAAAERREGRRAPGGPPGRGGQRDGPDVAGPRRPGAAAGVAHRCRRRAPVGIHHPIAHRRLRPHSRGRGPGVRPGPGGGAGRRRRRAAVGRPRGRSLPR